MIRKLFFLTVILLGSINAVISQNNFSIHGKIKGIESGLLYLNYTTIKDSSEIKQDGSFSFKGKVIEPTSAYLSLKQTGNSNKNYTTIFIEPSTMIVSLVFNDFEHVKITGSKTQKEFERLNKLKEPLKKEMEPWERKVDSVYAKLREAKQNKADEQVIDKLGKEADSVREEALKIYHKQYAVDFKYFADHPQSYITAFLLQRHLIDLALSDIKNYYAKLGNKTQQSSLGKNIKAYIDKKENVSIGTMAKNFSVTDINGDSISLNSYRGEKYVLLDFWASWCIPCRRESPHLKELYSRYKEKGLEIIGVSDDDNKKEEWKKAVHKDGLPWRQILRGYNADNGSKEYPNDLHRKYGVKTLPTQVLIDKNGIIIGRYDENGIPALDKKLKELFGD